jgi:drug/metabolite transporter (DMT)-like permease
VEKLIWLTPTLTALFLYGIGQGLVKRYIAEVPPARYCLYFFAAKTVVNLGYYLYQGHPWPLAGGGVKLLCVGTLAYVLEGVGWICYYESIVSGPITIVGTLSAAYAAPTVLFAYLFLGETLAAHQYVGVFLVIIGCVGLSYAPPDPDAKVTGRRWIPLALTALALWGFWQTVVKYSYTHLEATDACMAFYNVLGALLTYGLYGILFGRKGSGEPGEWFHSMLPMGMMAGGDLGVIIATATGPVSIVTPISSAYPVVTLGFAALVLKERITPLQWACLVLILFGMFASSAAA